MNNHVHNIFSDILAPYSPPVKQSPVFAALDRLGHSIASKELRENDRELMRNFDCCERLVDQIDEFMAEVRDDSLSEYARDEATRKAAKATAELQQRVQRSADLLSAIKESRAALGKTPHALSLIIDATRGSAA